MKIRIGFVTNSSSVAYICMISGAEESGQDLGLEEAGFCECSRGHVFLESYRLSSDEETVETTVAKLEGKLATYLEENGEDHWSVKSVRERLESIEAASDDAKEDVAYDAARDWELYSNYEIDPSECPICQMDYILEDDIIAFLLKDREDGETISTISDKIREKYANYKEMIDDLHEYRVKE